MSAHSDRNLLLGILALQMDFLSQDQLIAAMNAWVLEKSKTLGQLMVEQGGALTGETHSLLSALVDKHLEMHAGNPAASLAAISSVDSSLREQLQSIADPDVELSLTRVASLPSNDTEDRCEASLPATLSVGASTSHGVRFRILRPHAKGGLGRVGVRDEELKREVALKEIQEPYADKEDSRQRFVMEAEITGGLEHPGIVPVYGLGTYGDGRPFYAMRFVRGDSLKEAPDVS